MVNFRGQDVQQRILCTDSPGGIVTGQLETTQHSDTILAYSTLEKYASIRDPSKGSWYIRV